MTSTSRQQTSHARRVVLGLFVALSVGGCGLEPEPYAFRPIDEIPEGPGLFTGESGAFTVTIDPARGVVGPGPSSGTVEHGPKEGVLPRPASRPPYAAPR